MGLRLLCLGGLEVSGRFGVDRAVIRVLSCSTCLQTGWCRVACAAGSEGCAVIYLMYRAVIHQDALGTENWGSSCAQDLCIFPSRR